MLFGFDMDLIKSVSWGIIKKGSQYDTFITDKLILEKISAARWDP